MISKKESERLIGLDLLRGIAAFGIVGCHLSLSPRTEWGAMATVLCDFNVGVFAAVAGYLMGKGLEGAELNKQTVGTYVWKRVKRIVPEYLVWSVVFLGMTCAFDLLFDGGSVNPRYRQMSFWNSVFFWGGAAVHLWFLPSLLYAQILLLGASSLPLKGWMWIVCGFFLTLLSVSLGGWYATYPVRLLAFLVTGFGVHKTMRALSGRRFAQHSVRWWEIVTVIFSLCGYVALVRVIPPFICGWFATIPILVFCSSIRLVGRWASCASFLGFTSMGVYLIHPLITRGLSVVWVKLFAAPYGFATVISEWLLSWALALVFTVVMHRIPIFARYVK